jgi:hypothetical protein
MDKAAIFTEITQINALRRQAQLPLCDITSEYERRCVVARMSEYAAFCRSKMEDFNRIIAEVRLIHDGYCFGSRIALRFEVLTRFETLLETKYGVAKPPDPSVHKVFYGQGGN